MNKTKRITVRVTSHDKSFLEKIGDGAVARGLQTLLKFSRAMPKTFELFISGAVDTWQAVDEMASTNFCYAVDAGKPDGDCSCIVLASKCDDGTVHVHKVEDVAE